MWKTFFAEFKYIFSNKWKAIGWIFMLFIPLLYGFLYMNAYWSPFKHVDALKIAVVNLDKTGNDATSVAKSFVEKDTVTVAGDIYDITVVDSDIDSQEEAEEAVKAGKYSAVIIIPKNYSTEAQKAKQALITQATSSTLALSDISRIAKEFSTAAPITFYNSYKNNYLEGEMTNFGAGLSSLALKSLIPSVTSPAGQIVKALFDSIHTDDVSFIEHHKVAPNINTYGKGLSPYFISIALWAGALVMTFILKNERHIKDQNTLKHLTGKAACWIFSGWLQVAILMTGLTLQGIDLGPDQWKLFFFGIYTSGIFTMIVMGIAYSLRFGDLGEFAAVILLVLQLVSSSGTFPVEMQSIIFKIVHPFVPFTYSVNIFRELLYMPDHLEIVKNMAVLLIFPAIILPLTYYINYRFDKKNRIIEDSVYKYTSFEIHLGDL